jgi:hypothetical protein
VSTSLALAAGIGLMEMVGLIVGCGTLMDIVGIPVVRKTNLLPYSNFLDLKFLGVACVVHCNFFILFCLWSDADLNFQKLILKPMFCALLVVCLTANFGAR